MADTSDNMFQAFHASIKALGIGDMRACVAGVSGGPDSMALVHLLSRYMSATSGKVHAVTVDHGLRAEAGAEARQVGLWLSEWPGVDHTVLKWEGCKPATRIMEAARVARRNIMVDCSIKMGAKNIFLAHHLDDQAETFLIRLTKGSGLDGLCGMRALQDMGGATFCRPLLAFPKEKLVAYCSANDIPFIRDPSNANEAFLRPRLRKIRHALEAEGFSASRLSGTARRLDRAREALDFYTAQLLEEAVRERTSERWLLCHSVLARCPDEIRLRVVRRAVEDMLPGREYPPRLEKLEVIVEDAFAGKSFRKRTLGGLVFSVKHRRDEFIIEKERALGQK